MQTARSSNRTVFNVTLKRNIFSYSGQGAGRSPLSGKTAALEKMRYDAKSDMVIYRSKLHATLKRNYQLMPALQWLRLLLNHVPDKYEHLVRYYGYYSNRSRGARRLTEQAHDTPASIVIDEPTVDARRKANWARLIQKVVALGRPWR